MPERNIGKEIKQWAEDKKDWIRLPYRIVAIIMWFAAAFLAIEGYDAFISILIAVVGFLIWFVGNTIAYYSTLKLHGFGELVEQTMNTHYAVREFQAMLYKQMEQNNLCIEQLKNIVWQMQGNGDYPASGYGLYEQGADAVE